MLKYEYNYLVLGPTNLLDSNESMINLPTPFLRPPETKR